MVKALLRSGLCALAVAIALPAAAQRAFPSKPIRIILPAAAGGSLDLATRLIAQKMAENLGQPVIVDNRPGADQFIGTRAVKDAAPDGYTILGTTNGYSLQPFLKEEVAYDPSKDFDPVGIGIRLPFIMDVGAEQPYNTLAEFVARAKANPGKMTYASAGFGSPPHVAAALAMKAMNVDTIHVPYKGNGVALPDIAGGRVDAIFDGFISSQGYIKGSKVKVLAVTSDARISSLPDVPTFKEQGFNYSYTLWIGYMVPAGTPQAVVDKLADAIKEATNSPDLKQRFLSEGSDPTFVGPKEFRTYLTSEIAEMKVFAEELKTQAK